MTLYSTPVCTSSLVIFGGTGDLSRRKLIPALCHLRACGALPADLHVIITGRKPLETEALIKLFREDLEPRLKQEEVLRKGFEGITRQMRYLQIDPKDPQVQERFLTALKKIEDEGGAPAHLFYLALPPEQVSSFSSLLPIILDKHTQVRCPARLLVEKPFGHDLASAKALNAELLKIAREDQIMRIDHYLGKEAVQNIMVLRFANILFEPIWNHSHIDHVQISFAEKIGVGSRAAYFDTSGILRDVVQNHLLQVLCLMAMEPPSTHTSQAIRNEKLKVLTALKPLTKEEIRQHTVRAQYQENTTSSPAMAGYHQEKDIPPGSTTETYTAMKIFIDSWRWAGVPFYLRAGKRLSANLTEISIHFKQVPHSIFPAAAGSAKPNVLVIRVQPNEGIHLSVQTKIPGMSLKLASVDMNFSYQESFGSYRPDAYERLIIDALNGDSSLFLRNDEIEAAWEFIDPILAYWRNESSQPLPTYVSGTDGPDEAKTLIEQDGRHWRPLGGKSF